MSPDTKPNGPLIWSVLSIGVAALALLLLLSPVIGAAFGPSLEGDEIGDRVAKLMEQHDAAQARYQARFNGRSAFFKPKQPAPKREPPPETIVRDDKPKEPRDPPARRKPPYGGPAIKGFVGEQVWFANNLIVSVGDEKQGLRVLSVDLPRSAQVEYKGDEYRVDFLEPVPDDFFGVTETRGSADLPGITSAEDASETGASSNEERAAAAEGGDDGGASTDEGSESADETTTAKDDDKPAGSGVGGRRSGRNTATPRGDTPRKKEGD